MFVFMLSFNLLIPELNDYLTELGGADQKWMILGLWTIAAGLARPFSGKIADNYGRKITLYIGIIVSILVSFLYPFFISVTGFLVLRFLHGFSTGFHPTGATALVADVIPLEKRGEAMGIFSLTISLGFGLGNYLSVFVKQIGDMTGLFVSCGILGLVALITIPFIQESHQRQVDFSWQNTIPRFNEIIAPEVYKPAVIMFLTAMIGGMYYLLVPDFSSFIGLENKGLFYGFTSFTTIFIRFFAGRAADRYGRVKNIYAGLFVLAIAILISIFAKSPTVFMISGAVYGVATGILTPSLFAWTTDLANPSFKGRGMGTLFIALEFGIFAGTYFAQWTYDNKTDQFVNAYSLALLLTILSVLFMAVTAVKRKPKRL